MTIILSPEQERVLLQAIDLGLADSADEALDQALDALRQRLPDKPATEAELRATALRRLATFGQRHKLSLGGLKIKDLLRESRP